MCVLLGLLVASVDVVQPFVLGCDTKNPKIVQLSLIAVQRLISQQLLSKVCLFCMHIIVVSSGITVTVTGLKLLELSGIEYAPCNAGSMTE